MSLVLASLETAVVPTRALTSFQVLRCQVGPLFHLLSLHDDRHTPAHWIIPVPLKQLAKHPVLLWQLPTPGLPAALTCLDTGSLKLAPVHPGTPPNLRADLAEGTLRLHFEGTLLRGYYRLQRLPAGSGQLWQLTPIGYL
ncbi:MAG TPA: hypothetical protein VFO93_03620 [Hymenobacter sp.]|uniref:hypothetical protein n=1 Tax=Hymenobacter sp. TaxID=1898978 RepID=UPI002D80D6C7|nr:hypothetical protein [Hymenobacter sp.]HET9502601.1 hypothetical protein [Hymenobacter sp.]